MLSPELLEILICPACKRDSGAEHRLLCDDNQQGLTCPACRRVYPIRDGIPVLLIEEAQAGGAG